MHVSDVALAPAPDRTIWEHAREQGFVVVSKDEDFHRISVLHGPPPKVIWRLGSAIGIADQDRKPCSIILSIRRGLPPSEAAAVTAGRAMLRRLDALTGARRSFGFETTLASRSLAPRIRRLIAGGYECHLIFLWLPSPDQAVARVAARLRNLFSLYRPLTTTWRVYDNLADTPRLVASGAGTRTMTVEAPEIWHRIRAEVGHEGQD